MSRLILVVDDSVTIRKTLVACLVPHGYGVTEAEDGSAGVSLMLTQRVDLFIVDINMPKMNGIDFTKAVRNVEHYRQTPLLILTTESSLDMKQTGQVAGATAWMIKPFKPDVLLRSVGRLLP